MQVDRSIFKAYDIRGVVPEGLNESVAEAVGNCFGTMAQALGETTVAVGRDGRTSSPALGQAVIRGLVASGIRVIDIGRSTTPMLYFAASTLCRSGMQITGSHNPKDHNGIKMVLSGRAFFGRDIQALRHMVESEAWVNRSDGGVIRSDILPAYRTRIVRDITLARPMKIAIDCGNGIAGASAPAIFRALGCEVVELFSDVDGSFPNHHPDPSRAENLVDLIAAVRASDAELGLAFDGDGDRLGVVTRDGNTIYPDRQMMLFARDVLVRAPSATILFDVKCSQRLASTISDAGGRPVMCATGHSLIKAKMKELEGQGVEVPLAGEMAGHIFFKERWFGFDDGTYCGARLLEIVSRATDASAVLDALPNSFSTPELHIACAEGEAHALVQQLNDQPRHDDEAMLTCVDGLRFDWSDGFGLIRASNTNPELILRFEGHTTAALERITSWMTRLLHTVKPDATIPSWPSPAPPEQGGVPNTGSG